MGGSPVVGGESVVGGASEKVYLGRFAAEVGLGGPSMVGGSPVVGGASVVGGVSVVGGASAVGGSSIRSLILGRMVLALSFNNSVPSYEK